MVRYFCAFPFEHLEITSSGHAYLCCVGRLKVPVGNIAKSTIRELWNCEAAKDIRASILDNSFRYCNECRYYKAKFFHVKKDGFNEREAEYLTGKVPPLPRRVVLSMDRACQLSCPSCRHGLEASSTGSADFLQEKVLNDPDIGEVTFLWTSGAGDPLYSEVHRKMLVQIGESRFGKVQVGLHTNGLLFQRVWQEISPASRSRIKRVSVSVDGASKETHEANRRGSHWNALISNLRFLKSLKEEGQLDKLKLLFIVQQNNWREMSQFVHFAKSMSANRVVFAALGNWGTYTTLEYNKRAVQRPEHSEHAAFTEALQAPELKDSIVHQKIMAV